MTDHRMNPGKIGKKVVDACKKVEEAFVDTFLEKEERSDLRNGKNFSNFL